MSTFFPEIKALEAIPSFHYEYAENILKLLIKTLLELEQIEVGIFEDNRDSGSIITFSDSQFENVIVELRYQNQDFHLIVKDNSEDFDTSSFKYTLQGALLDLIPDGFKSFMEKVALEDEPALLTPRALE